MAKIGAHVSASGGVFNAPLNAQKEGLETFQMFTRSPQTFQCPPLPDENVAQFLENTRTLNFPTYYIHAPYLVNLASANNRTRHGSINMLKQELERGTKLKAQGVMFHTGSAASQPSREVAMVTAIKSINTILEGYTGSCKLLIENAAGSGSVLGCTFEEIGEMMKGIVNVKTKVGFCLDTQHAFGSGYDLRTKADVDALVKAIDKHIGLKKLAVVQVNDSKVEFNSKRDRHEHITNGHIGKAGFGYLINHPKLKHLDFVLETPFEGRASDVKILKQIRKK